MVTIDTVVIQYCFYGFYCVTIEGLEFFNRNSIVSLLYGGPKVSRQFQLHHGNFNLTTAISIWSRQFQLHSRQFQFGHGYFNFAHGNFNLTTAISTSLTAISIWSRQFQFDHGNFNFTHGNLNFVPGNIFHPF